ncbi:L domain-like protein [Neocallimastix lanati (nom. inval.)]|uniref:L domain-like protein n=1 Tax=Neocallimastix californiae TaxID=1754190 RepID=A0A1Y1Y8T9_9FUNG|nr:L domain-like protein [Neocallimastix sp. JGI-2020a]ORX93984.1 L domain-like protein [Neocallimastix californiae]|eukprot:ORX93984.1 L domain-like protein [Neocallimastix californiae]
MLIKNLIILFFLFGLALSLDDPEDTELEFSESEDYIDFTGKCKEIVDFIESKKSVSYDNIVYKCKVNDKGEVILLKLRYPYTNDKDEVIQKILSYDTVRVLYLEGYDPDGDDESSTTINAKIFTDLKNLEKLSLLYIKLSQSNIDEITSLKNLKELNLELYSDINDLKFDSFDQLDKLTKLTISNPTSRSYTSLFTLNKNILNHFKYVKELYISGLEIKQQVFNDISNMVTLENLSIGIDSSLTIDLTKMDKLKDLSLFPYSEHNISENISFKLPKNIESLAIDINLSNDNVNEIGKLTKLETLTININSVSIDPFENLNNLKVLNIGKYNGYEKDKFKLKFPKGLKELYIDEIELSNANFEEIASLTSLEKLRITYNELKSIPESIYSLENLKELSFHGQQITSISDKIKNLKNLVIFDLSDNEITTLPESIVKLEKLENLNLKCNKLTKIPEKIGELKNLSIFELSYNEITTLPESFGNLTNLKEIRIEGNKLTTLPESLGNLENLEILDANENKINNLPESIGKLKNLKYLKLDYNKISKIPESLGNAKNLEYLNLEVNKIYDELPDSLNSLSKLEYINLSGNVNILGKTLTNPSLTNCYYSSDYSLCIAKDMDCLNYNYSFDEIYIPKKHCSTSTNNDKCGKGIGKCPEGQCCGKDGICSSKETSCSIKEGCQQEYGLCLNKCEEMRNQIRRLSDHYELPLKECKVNDAGEIIYLNYIYSFDENYETYISMITSISSLKELTIKIDSEEDLTQKTLEDISKLKNLEKLEIAIPFINEISLKPLENIKNLKEFKYYMPYSYAFNILNDFPNIPTLKNLHIENVFLTKNGVNDLSKLTNLENLTFLSYSRKSVNTDVLSKLKNLKSLEISDCTDFKKNNIPSYIYSLPNLKNLTISNLYYELDTLPKKLFELTNLENLALNNNRISEIPKEIENLKNLVYLKLSYNKRLKIPKELANLKNLKSLYLNGIHGMANNLDIIKNFTDLENLGLSSIGLKKFPSFLEQFTKLRTLDLFYNEIDEEIPQYLNSFPNLELIDLSGNYNLKGRILTNSKLIMCNYDEDNNNLCIDKGVEIPCLRLRFEDYEKIYKECSSDSAKTSTTKTSTSKTSSTKTSTSKTSSTKTSSTKTSTSKTSSTKTSSTKTSSTKTSSTKTSSTKTSSTKTSSTKTSTTKTSTTKTASSNLPTSKTGKCGKEDGQCPSNECCSKYGYCGTTSSYCSIAKGCQSEFGQCRDSSNPNPSTTKTTKKTVTKTTTISNIPTSTTGRCGKKDGQCPSGKCCSKYGYCGTTSSYCSVAKGCQSEFGQCETSSKTSTTKTSSTKTASSNLPTSTTGRCGKKDGQCPSNECCSKYGYCGRSSDHCSIDKGCQSEFGQCKLKQSTNGRCGKKDGQCPSNECCSKYGYCGRSSNHCSIAKGCQSEFGKCNN